MNNQECKVIPEIVNINSIELLFYPCSIKTSKSGGSCNNISHPYVKLCVPDNVKNLKIKVFSLMSRINETRHIKWHETCKCKCRLNGSAYNNKQRWNEDKCMCECKELIDKGMCDKGFIWNPGNCKCECNKSCDIGEYLDYSNCKCRKILVTKLIEECTESIDGVKITKITQDEKMSTVLTTIYIALFLISFIINIGIGTYFTYYKHMCRNKENGLRYDYTYQAKNY